MDFRLSTTSVQRSLRYRLVIGLAIALFAAGCVADDPVVTDADGAAEATDVSQAEQSEDAPVEETATEPESTDDAEADDEAADEPAEVPADELSDAAVQNGPEVEAAGYDFSAVHPVMQTAIEAAGLTGAGIIIVHEEDGVVYHDHWGSFGPDHISLVASASKMISAGVLLNLADQGLLDMNGSVAEITGWTGHNDQVTPAQLVSNSSGLVGLQPGYPPYLCQFSAGASLTTCGETIFTSDLDDEEVITPDTEFRYGGGQWQVAGAVAEVVSGKSWEQLIDEVYVQPCGLESLGFNNHWAEYGAAYPTGLDPRELSATENPQIEGGGYLTTGDYGKLLLMLLQDGRCGDTQVLSPDAVSLMTTDRVGPLYGEAASEEFGYGMGWWVDYDSGRITDDGLYGAVPWLDLEDGYGGYLAVESEGWERPGSDKETIYELVDQIMAAAAG